MYKSEDAKRAYFANRYQNKKEEYKQSQNNYWINYAKKQLNKEDVTDEEVKKCRNEYYRNYRRNNNNRIQNITSNFWNNQTEKLNKVGE